MFACELSCRNYRNWSEVESGFLRVFMVGKGVVCGRLLA